jgi:hypothetical protein
MKSLSLRCTSKATPTSRGELWFFEHQQRRTDIDMSSDAVFGVKSSLIVEANKVEDPESAKEAGFRHAPFYLMTRDFVLITSEEAEQERRKTRPTVV